MNCSHSHFQQCSFEQNKSLVIGCAEVLGVSIADLHHSTVYQTLNDNHYLHNNFM